MKFIQILFAGSVIVSVSALPFRTFNFKRQTDSFDGLSFDEIDQLTPQFGHDADVNPDGTGSCDGAVDGTDGQPIKVPCDCPPDRTTFIQDLINNLNAGEVINNPSVPFSFPTDNSTASIQARFNAASVTLQNLNGTGKGCPQSATTWTAQLQAILAGTSSSTVETSSVAAAADSTTSSAVDAGTTTSAADVAASTTTSASASATSLSSDEIDQLTPDLGWEAGVNPDGTGNCDGAVDGADGTPIQVPCACPPDRATFISALGTDIAAGQVINNPSVPFSFPTDNSTDSQIARVQASLVALQNLNGTGKGCPASSTTLLAQLKALQAEQ